MALTYRSHQPDDTLAKIEALGVKGAAVKADFSGMDQTAAEDVVGFAGDALGGHKILVNKFLYSPIASTAASIARYNVSLCSPANWRRYVRCCSRASRNAGLPD